MKKFEIKDAKIGDIFRHPFMDQNAYFIIEKIEEPSTRFGKIDCIVRGRIVILGMNAAFVDGEIIPEFYSYRCGNDSLWIGNFKEKIDDKCIVKAIKSCTWVDKKIIVIER